VAALASTAAEAAITVYTTEAGFLAAISAPGTDDFEDANGFFTSPLTRSAGVYSYATNATGGLYFGNVGGGQVLSTNNSVTLSFNTFTGGVSALGGFFFNTDSSFNVVSGPVTVSAADADGTNTQIITGATTASFLGFVSNGALLSAAVTPAGGGNKYATVNNLTLGEYQGVAGVPEPASWAMLIAGFGLTGAAMRRRRVAATIA